MWPIDDSTMKSGPSMPPMVRALAGDSTMTSALPTAHLAVGAGWEKGVGMVTSECGSVTRLSRAGRRPGHCQSGSFCP